jgi:hypothetical protein
MQEVVDICYQLVFVYNSTGPSPKVEFPSTLSDGTSELSHILSITDKTINKIIISDIPHNYYDLWISSKLQYFTWARDKAKDYILKKMNKNKN